MKSIKGFSNGSTARIIGSKSSDHKSLDFFMLSNWLIDTELFAAPEDLSIFQKELPLESIEQALVRTDKH